MLLSGEFSGTDEVVTFGIQAQPGRSADLFGIQVEAQAGASGYKMTTSNSGVYPTARFLDDALSITTDGPDQHSCQDRHSLASLGPEPMATIFQEKELSATETPILLVRLHTPQWRSGAVEHAQGSGQRRDVRPRVLQYNIFEMQTSSDMGVDAIPKVSVTLANADSHFSEIERSVGWKGAQRHCFSSCSIN